MTRKGSLKRSILIFVLLLCPGLLFSGTADTTGAVLGYGFLKRIPGLWNGPVSSKTPAGSFAKWYVDFRPVSSSQVSQYSTLDADTLNYISFFIVKHENRLKVAMRTEGVFQNKGCVTYEVIDKVNDKEGYYRFSDFQTGEKRAYTEFKFKNNDAFVMEVYTSKFNKVYPLQLHSRWTATRAESKSAAYAVSHFNFPQPVMTKDFSGVFRNMYESIYYTFENDPYPSQKQPYVGSVTVRIARDDKLRVKENSDLCLLLTTESLYVGMKYDADRLKYISRLAHLPGKTRSHVFKNVHPGTYYVYAFVDVNRDGRYLSGDYMSSDINHTIAVKEIKNVDVDVKIDFVIP